MKSATASQNARAVRILKSRVRTLENDVVVLYDDLKALRDSLQRFDTRVFGQNG